jgi:hypothetical protein
VVVAREPRQVVDQDDVELAGRRCGQQSRKARAVRSRAGLRLVGVEVIVGDDQPALLGQPAAR